MQTLEHIEEQVARLFALSLNTHMILHADTSRSDTRLWNLKRQKGLTEISQLQERPVKTRATYLIWISNQREREVMQESLLLPGFCISWHICRFLSRPGWCWIHCGISVRRTTSGSIRFNSKNKKRHVIAGLYGAPWQITQVLSGHFTHSWLLSQVSIHLLLAERRHFLYLLVVALHSLLVLWNLLGIKQLVGGGVLKNKTCFSQNCFNYLLQ